MKEKFFALRPAGYRYLQEKLGIVGMSNWHYSSVSNINTHHLKIQEGFIEEIFRKQYWPGEELVDHLEFALKYDGVNLGLIARIFEHIPQEEVTKYVKSKPTSIYARRIWFFYEFLTGNKLPVNDISSGNYVNVLEPNKYYTIQSGEKSQRHRIINNLLGTHAFCPIIRRTDKLIKLESDDLRERCEEITANYSPELLRRALSYLYNKETKSSFDIENITPIASRTERFVSLLKLAEKEDFCDKERLIELQNRIVDPRFKNTGYRHNQNYIGQTVSYQKELIHYISPKPDDLPMMMSGLIETHKRMKKSNLPSVIHAAVIAYGFVFLHPFEDGNGRIHRFLIHNILSLHRTFPHGLMFPISAVMLKNSAAYDESLEVFSRPLLQLIDYRLDGMGHMTVQNDTAVWYQYIDMTAQAEALYDFVVQTINEEVVNELSFLADYDKTKKMIQAIIDMPDRLVDLFINLCLQNNGTLSAGKRSTYFDFLTDNELASMEQVIKETFNRHG